MLGSARSTSCFRTLAWLRSLSQSGCVGAAWSRGGKEKVFCRRKGRHRSFFAVALATKYSSIRSPVSIDTARCRSWRTADIASVLCRRTKLPSLEFNWRHPSKARSLDRKDGVRSCNRTEFDALKAGIECDGHHANNAEFSFFQRPLPGTPSQQPVPPLRQHRCTVSSDRIRHRRGIAQRAASRGIEELPVHLRTHAISRGLIVGISETRRVAWAVERMNCALVPAAARRSI